VELASFLELLYTAGERSRTVCATVNRWQDEARFIQLLKERGFYQELPPIPPEEGEWPSMPDESRATTRIWIERPDKLRWESDHRFDGGSPEQVVGVKDGERFWARDMEGEVDSNADRPFESSMSIPEEVLFEPAPLLGAVRFQLDGEADVRGRAALRVRATKRRDGPLTERPELLSSVADKWEALVDRERGVLLYLGALAGGAALSTAEVVDIAFDEPLPGALFEPLS
jgi:outer membrane lipoprotein-sorting protein